MGLGNFRDRLAQADPCPPTYFISHFRTFTDLTEDTSNISSMVTVVLRFKFNYMI